MVSLTHLLDEYRVDLAHARYVADLALTLHDSLEALQKLPRKVRALTELAALSHNLGMTTNPAKHHLVGRDLFLRQPVADLSDSEQAIVAATIAFHRKKVRPAQEPSFLALKPKQQELALQVAALVRVADGLDYSQSQTTQIIDVDMSPAGLTLLVSGPASAEDAARALAKADLWAKVFAVPLAIQSQTSETVLPPPVEEESSDLLPLWYADGGAPLAELCRVQLREQLRRLLIAERKVPDPADHEAVHELRVATRRLRAVLELSRAVAPAALIGELRKGVRQVARAAAAVRDSDVLLINLDQLASELGPAGVGLESAIEALQHRRAVAHQSLLTYLASPEHAKLIRKFARFLVLDAKSWNETIHIRDLAGSTLWRGYEALRAYPGGAEIGEEMLTDDLKLHDMRIEAKHLRYSLEIFGEVLGSRFSEVIKPLAEVQEALGELNDLAVAGEALSDLPISEEATAAYDHYLETRRANRPALAITLSKAWAKVGSATYRRRLMELIVKL